MSKLVNWPALSQLQIATYLLLNICLSSFSARFYFLQNTVIVVWIKNRIVPGQGKNKSKIALLA